MASGTNYLEEYGQAEKAYREGDFARAAEIIDRLAEEHSDNPNILLLKGHIYCSGFQNYELATEQYQAVLGLSSEQDLVDCAYAAIEQVRQLQEQAEGYNSFAESEDQMDLDYSEEDDLPDFNTYDSDFDPDSFADDRVMEEDVFDDSSAQEGNSYSFTEDVSEELENEGDYEDPFAEFDSPEIEEVKESNSFEFPVEPETYDRDISNNSVHNTATFMVETDEEEDDDEEYLAGDSFADFDDNQAVEIDSQEENHLLEEEEELEEEFDNEFEVDGDFDYNNFSASNEIEVDTVLTEPHAIDNSEGFNFGESAEHDGLDYQDELEFDEIDSSFFDLEELEQGLPDTGLFNVGEDLSGASAGMAMSQAMDSSSLGNQNNENYAAPNPESGVVTTESDIEPVIEVKQGFLGGFINAPMSKKLLVTACCTGIVSAIAVFGAGVGTSILFAPKTEGEKPGIDINRNALISLVAGIAGFGTTMVFGSVITKQMDRATQNLQSQFDDVYQGNLNAKATVYSQDEFGRLATGFNRMTRVILTTTQEAQRRAEETEQAKEDLQRQVIRLLDDVEGAARGDLTVQATVTADVLGAVADAFNLTIQSLREIVRQVKEAAEQVNKSSTDSELFARNQSSEALRMAEELAVTLNSVQMMIESIERVAENAR